MNLPPTTTNIISNRHYPASCKSMLLAPLIRLTIASMFLLTCTSKLFAETESKSKAIDQVKVSILLRNASIMEAFRQIEQQTSFHFMYRIEDVRNIRDLNLVSQNQSVADILKIVLSRTSLHFRQIDDQILIRSKRPEYFKAVNMLELEEQEFSITESQALITGTVTDSRGGPLTGVTVKVKGTNLGTSTDANGRYSINAPSSSGTLVFTFIGFNTQEVAIEGRATIDVVLKEESKALTEVVVTALGIRRESKRLGYSATSVGTEQLTTNRTTNVGNSLQGKVAGLNVSAPAAGPGSSSKIRIRGQSSFGGNNSPLIVVNGVPINNTSVSAGGSAGNGTGNPTGGSSDAGDGLQSINPDDIESMTILKGAAAAALYGSRAKDGAIIITTKSGRGSTGIGVEVNSSFQVESALDYTDFQYEYGQGEFGKRPLSVADAQSSGVHSFGERFDGQPTPQFDGSTQPYQPYKNRIKDFYRAGLNATNSISLSGGNDNGNFRLAFANTEASSIMPNSGYHRKVLNLGVNYNLTKKLSTQVNANYSNEYNKNPPQIGIQDMSANSTIYTLANSIDVDWLKKRKDENGNEMPLARFTNRNNPYWVAYDRFENVRRDRIFGNVSLRYQFFDWLYAQGRFGQDYFTRPYDYNRPTGTRSVAAATTGFNGYYYQDISTFRERNMDFLIGANKTFGKFGIDVTLGGNQMKQVNTNNSNTGTNFFVRDVYTIMNAQIKSPLYSYIESRVNSLYGSADLSLNNYLFLTITARNDWFSTLNPQSNNYLYPSVSSSFVFSDAIKSLPGWLNYGKLRAAYAEVGGGTSPYVNNLYYSINANTYSNGVVSGVALGSPSTSVAPNPNLKPLSIKEAEIGLELRTLNSRVNLDIAAYRKNTHNEILQVDISNSSGYSQTIVNVGKLRNEGVEALLILVPVLNNNVRWESSFNASINKSEVLQLADGQSRLDAGTGEFFGTLSHEVGKPLGSLRGFDYRRDNQGRILTSGGLPLQGSLTTFGSALPKYFGGWINTVTYNKFRLTTQIDFKAGYKIMSNSNMNFLREGLSQQSLVGREGGVVFPGVNADGSPNTTAVEAEAFYTVYRTTNIATPFIYDGSFIRWRALTVGYDFTNLVGKSFVKGLTLNATVNNVLMIKKHLDNLDPEAQVSVSDNLQGIESHTLPTTRTYGLSLNAKF